MKKIFISTAIAALFTVNVFAANTFQNQKMVLITYHIQ
jgi:hypothetical protein